MEGIAFQRIGAKWIKQRRLILLVFLMTVYFIEVTNFRGFRIENKAIFFKNQGFQ